MIIVVLGLDSFAPAPDRPFPFLWALLALAVVTVAGVYRYFLAPSRFKDPKGPDGEIVPKQSLFDGISRMATGFALVPLAYGFLAYKGSGDMRYFMIFVAVSIGAIVTYWKRLTAVARAIEE